MVEKTVEGLRKPEDGTQREVGSSRAVDTIGDVAKRAETLAAWCRLERGGRKERRRDSVEEKQTRENEPDPHGSGDGRFEWPRGMT